MQKYESSLPPPVPPRRKRSKSDTRRSSPTQPRATKPERKHRPAPLPPTAPQRTKAGKKTPSPTPNYSKYSFPTASTCDGLDYSLDNRNGMSWIDSINGNNEVNCNLYDESNNSRESRKRSRKSENKSLEFDYSRSSSQSSSPFSKSPEPNKYPPLYFTFEDYKKVVEESSNEKDASSEDILEQIEETSKKIEEISEKVEEVTEQVDEIAEKIEEISEQAISPFAENVLFETEREEIYFRVTTTNRPFEKCLGEWSTLHSEDNEYKEDEPNDTYIFEDYMDRNNKLNRPHILKLNEEFMSRPQDEDSTSTEKITTKVRFIIESPSTSTPDIDFEDDGTSYGDFIEKTFLNYEKSSVQLREITDEEVETFDKKISNVAEDENETDTTNKFDSEIVEDEENVSDSLYGLTANQINDSYSEWEEDIDVFSSATFVDDEPKMDVANHGHKISNLEESTDFIDKRDTQSESQVEEINKVTEETSKKQTILIDTSFYNLSEEDEWDSYFEKCQVNLKDDKTQHQIISKINESLLIYDNFTGIDERDDTIDDVEDSDKITTRNTAENNVENSRKISKVIPIIEISPAEDKPVPENVLRNFFLETMLSSNISSQSTRGTSTVNCEVIAAHPKQDPSTSPDKRQCTEPATVVVAAVATEEKEEEAAPTNGSRIELTEPGALPKALRRIDASSSNNKSAGEVKGDVLNELLTNFSAIKLKPVKTVVHKLSPLKNSNESEENTEQIVEVKTEENNETRQVEEILEKNEDVLENRNEDENSKMNLSSDLLAETTPPPPPPPPPPLPTTVSCSSSSGSDAVHVSKDTSAIIEEASHTERNDNDNKATTPVVVNKDQPREAVSIVPGSVKSFVKYYEIQSEICSIAKIKDNLFKKQSERARDKQKRKLTKADEKSRKTLKQKTGVKVSEESSSKLSAQRQPSPLNSPKPHIQKQSCLKTMPSPKCERKKSVQFDGEDVVIYPPKKEKEKEKNEEEGMFSSLIGGIKTKLTRNKSPVKSSVNKIDQQNGLKVDQHCSDGAAIICIQKSPEARAVACSAIPGNNRSFLPQTETLQSNQTIVFYCTI